MKCNQCGCEKAYIVEEDKPVKGWQILLAIILFPIGLLFVCCRGKHNVRHCPECGFKQEL